MPDRLLLILLASATLGAGVIAGVFFAFSTFVMKALRRRPAREGMAAMQAINVVVINPAFLGGFLGTAGLCAIVLVAAILRSERAGTAWAVAGTLLYLIGTFGVTMVCNVPLNNALEKQSADDPRAERVWADYVTRWTRWNHVRTIAAIAGMAAMIGAICRWQ